MKKLIILSTCAAMLAVSASALEVRTSGFINVVGGINDLPSEEKDLINGYDNKYDFLEDSLAAVQFNAKVADKMGAVVQIIAQDSEVDDNIHMEWGYVYYDATESVRILAGRIRPSLFLYSNYLDVGYAYTWITPPSEVYYQAQITNLDGINVSYTLELDDSTVSFNAYGGNSRGKKLNPADGGILDFSYDSIWGAEIAYINDYLKLRAGYAAAKVTCNTDTFTTTTPPAIVSALEFKDSGAAFYGVGLNLDYEDFLFASEYIVREMDETVAPDVNSYYAMIGYRIGNFTPSYTYAVADSKIDFVNTGASTDAMINSARAGQLDDRTSHTIGVRYDVNTAAAIKLEYNHATVTTSTYTSGTSLKEEDKDINTYRIALNVTF